DCTESLRLELLRVVEDQYQRFLLRAAREQVGAQRTCEIAAGIQVEPLEYFILQCKHARRRLQKKDEGLASALQFANELCAQRGLACAALSRDFDDPFVDVEAGDYALQDIEVRAESKVHGNPGTSHDGCHAESL